MFDIIEFRSPGHGDERCSLLLWVTPFFMPILYEFSGQGKAGAGKCHIYDRDEII